MTQDEITRLADLAFDTPDVVVPAFSNGFYTVTPEELQRFAILVAAAEREACAQTCEERHANGNYQHDTRHECAEAIRARGQP